jgi:hypothetical protein
MEIQGKANMISIRRKIARTGVFERTEKPVSLQWQGATRGDRLV